METTKKQSSHWWWFDRHNNNNTARSQWLQSTLSVLDQKTEEMLRIIEEDADSFSQRAEMYYKKRPQLVGMVEDFYRAHRSLAEQFDHLRHEPGARRTSPLARSFSLKMDEQEKEVCFTKLAYDSEDSSEKSLNLLKPFKGCCTDVAYDSDESVDSEVDDPILEAKDEAIDMMSEVLSSAPLNHQDLMDEIARLKEQLMEKDNTIGELKLKLSETANEVKTLREDAGALRMENVEMYLQKIKETEEKEQLIVENSTLNKLLIQNDEAMKLTETAIEVKTLREEAGKLRMESVEMYLQKIKEAEEKDIMAKNLKKVEKEVGVLQMEIQEQREMLEEKDEGKREAIRQLSFAIEMLKSENRLLKKTIVNESNKKWNPFEIQVLKGFGKILNCSIMSSKPSVVPL